MKGLQIFSVRGLRFFESILLILGSLLLPLFLLTGSSVVKLFIGFVFVSIFIGFYSCEKAISRKPRYKVKAHHTMNEKQLRTICVNKIKQFTALSKEYRIQHNEEKLSIGERLTIQLNQCDTVADLIEFKEELTEQLSGLIKHIQKKEQRSREYSQSTAGENVSADIVQSQSSIIKQSLQVLNLPENTRDMVQIKNAYKKMIKKYHPDVNQTEEAGKKTVELNLAYECLVNSEVS